MGRFGVNTSLDNCSHFLLIRNSSFWIFFFSKLTKDLEVKLSYKLNKEASISSYKGVILKILHNGVKLVGALCPPQYNRKIKYKVNICVKRCTISSTMMEEFWRSKKITYFLIHCYGNFFLKIWLQFLTINELSVFLKRLVLHQIAKIYIQWEYPIRH